MPPHPPPSARPNVPVAERCVPSSSVRPNGPATEGLSLQLWGDPSAAGRWIGLVFCFFALPLDSAVRLERGAPLPEVIC